MATPIGFINGKPVFGPPLPPLSVPQPPPGPVPAIPSAFTTMISASLSGIPEASPNIPANPLATLFPSPFDIAMAFEEFEFQHLAPYTLLTIWERPPHGLACPASINGWTAKKGEGQFPGRAWDGTSDCGDFNKLPPELREKIYAEAVELRFSSLQLRHLEELESEENGHIAYVRLGSVNRTRETVMIVPGVCLNTCADFGRPGEHLGNCQACDPSSRPAGGEAISNNLGLLLANRQIHAEASKVLYSRNTFGILIDAAHLDRTFWNCGLPDCHSPDRPCLLAPRNLAQIKHLVIVMKGSKTSMVLCGESYAEMTALRAALQKVVTVLRESNVRLKTLDIRYAGVWNGRLDLLLSQPFVAAPGYEHENLKAHLALPGGPLVLVRTPTGEEYFESPLGLRFPVEHADIFGPLRKLRGRVEYCRLRGDLPTKYLRYMRGKMDRDADPSVPVKILRDREERVEARRMEWMREVAVANHALRKSRAEAAGENI
ncbi:hypothetical protein FKW77_007432 [Venturia effusa]|uniref:DUF7730 domain-containing protein n=1 Tax=Venturia effusa TaxID=50376 RepID=A0A517LFW7_9PEZI|nr:hypothetical protein FKW77_007432 [Venturia effusa]